MKSLEEHLRFKSLDSRAHYIYNKKKYKNFFGDHYYLVENKFEEDPFHTDHIFEMLQSHDTDRLMKFLQDNVFSVIDNNITINKETPGHVTNIIIETPNRIVADVICSNKEFKKLLFYFNYYITLREDTTIHLEPKFTDKINDFIFDECNGIVYHITRKKYLVDIQRRGLRCMKAPYREYPEKIFLFATKNFKYPNKCNDELRKFAKETEHYGNDFVVLKINLNKQSGINIYMDKGLDYEGAGYTFDNISPGLIEIYMDTLDL